jgi:hypothetical protein
MENVLVAILIILAIVCIPFAIREQIKRNRWWKNNELKFYLDDLYKMRCGYCDGSGYEAYTKDGEPTGEICEYCESFGFVWRAICPPKWLKHGNIWRQSEIESLKLKIK